MFLKCDKFRKQAIITRGKVNNRQGIKRFYQERFIGFNGLTQQVRIYTYHAKCSLSMQVMRKTPGPGRYLPGHLPDSTVGLPWEMSHRHNLAFRKPDN